MNRVKNKIRKGIASLLTVVLVVGLIPVVPGNTITAQAAFVDNVKTIGTVASAATSVVGFASKIYDAVVAAKDADEGEGAEQFFMQLLGKNDVSLDDIQGSVSEINGKIDDITTTMNELSDKTDTIISQINTMQNTLDTGLYDLKVNLYSSQIQMQNWTTIYTQINNFYTKYGDVRTTLESTIEALNNRATDYDDFLATVSAQTDGANIRAAIDKLDAACSNYDSLTDEEKTLLSTEITFNGSTYTVYKYVSDYSAYVYETLDGIYDKFASGYSVDMYTSLLNMANYILGQNWTSSESCGIGELYYKLSMMTYSNSDEVHEAYESFVAGVEYDFLLTAYVCALSLKSQIAYLEQTGGNSSTIATYKENLETIDDLIGQVLVYADYEYEKCIMAYDFDGFVPDGDLTYADYTVYYGNSVNYVNGSSGNSYFVSNKAASLSANTVVTNQNVTLAVGETDRIRVWYNGEEVQSDYKLVSGSNCVVVNEDGTIVGIRPGTAKIYLVVDSNYYHIAYVTVSSCFAIYDGSGTNTYVYDKNGTQQSITYAGEGYTYEYCSNISSLDTRMDSSSSLTHRLGEYVTFESEETTLSDYEVYVNHTYGKVEKQSDGDIYAICSHAYVGAVLMVGEADGEKTVTTIPISNESGTAVEKSDVTYYDYTQDADTVYIYTKEELIEWKEAYDTDYASAKKNVKLMADIDFEWGEWEGVTYALMQQIPGSGKASHADPTVSQFLESLEVKTYTFDGNGHTIRNITFAPTSATMYYYEDEVVDTSTGETQPELKSESVTTWGFFSTLSGTLKNLTIENVVYTGYPTDGYDYSTVRATRIISVFASLAYSEKYWWANASWDVNGDTIYNVYPNLTTWTCEISNCVAAGTSDGVNTVYSMNYDPFGNLWLSLKNNRSQYITVKNCVYAMEFDLWTESMMTPTGMGYWRVSIFNSYEPNLYVGHIGFGGVYTQVRFVNTDYMTDEEKAAAKENISVISGSYLYGMDLTDYTIITAKQQDASYWTDRGWDTASVNRMLAGNDTPAYQGEFSVDLSDIKGYYHIGESFDAENLIVYENGTRTTNYSVSGIDTGTAGEKTVTVTSKSSFMKAVFTVTYTDIVTIKYTYNDTTYIRAYEAGSSFQLESGKFENMNAVYTQSGWVLKAGDITDAGMEYSDDSDDDTKAKVLSYNSSVTATEDATYVPAWKQGDLCTVTFGSTSYTLPKGSVITVPTPVYGVDYTYEVVPSRWVKVNNGSLEYVSFGSSYTISANCSYELNCSYRFNNYYVSFYLQDMDSDTYSFFGTWEGSGKIGAAPTYGNALIALGGPKYSDCTLVQAEAEYYWNYLGNGLYSVGGDENNKTHIILYLTRPSYTVTWLDTSRNEIQSDTVTWGAMPTAPSDEAAGAPEGYTVAWDSEITEVTGAVTYTVSGYTPKDGTSYTVNHYWQNIDDDDYTLYETETLTGTTEADTVAEAKEYTGFTAQDITQSVIAGDGSTVVNVYYDRKEYTVIWDIEGVTATEQYRYGATPTYKGDTPTKAFDGKYNYTFSGWGTIVEVTDDVTYTAQFASELCQYTITWDVDGVTTTEVYTYGDIPEYKGDTPVRASTEQYHYTFRDWGEITEVTGDKTYTANFDSTLVEYTITWDVEGETVTETYKYGDTPSYKGVTPVKAADESGSYIFNGWGQLETVTGDKIYTAVFISTANTYTITWDVNGEKLTETYKYGDTPTYKGVTPTKEATAQYSYTFTGWGEVTAVTGNKTYTAQFTAEINYYTITWNVDGSQTTEQYAYGETPSYKGSTPARATDAQYTYSFRDWGTISTVTGDKTYTATFDTTVNKYNITWIIGGTQFTETYDYGAMPVYKGYVPTKEATAQYTYTFDTWGDIVAVTGNKTYTAQFTAEINYYTITWDVDGCQTTEEYAYGETPTYKGSTPFRAEDAAYTYTFSGWGTIQTVSGDKTYTAQFTAQTIVTDKITSDVVEVSETEISGVSAGTTTEKLLESCDGGEYCKVYSDGKEISEDTAVGTGMLLCVMNGDTVVNSYTIIVSGDVNGDGAASITDLLAVKAHLLNKSELTEAYASAADTNGDGSISITDFLQQKAQLLGKSGN